MKKKERGELRKKTSSVRQSAAFIFISSFKAESRNIERVPPPPPPFHLCFLLSSLRGDRSQIYRMGRLTNGESGGDDLRDKTRHAPPRKTASTATTTVNLYPVKIPVCLAYSYS